MSFAKQRQRLLSPLLYLVFLTLLLIAFTLQSIAKYDEHFSEILKKSRFSGIHSQKFSERNENMLNISNSSKSSVKRDRSEDGYIHFRPDFKVSQLEKGNLNQDCHCKSLFTISDCEDRKKGTGAHALNYHWKSVLSRLKNTRESGGYWTDLQTLARYLPQEFIVQNLSRSAGDTVGILTNEDDPLPYVGCTEKVYDAQTTGKCLESFKKERKKALQITFVGDSHARFMMAYMMKSLLGILFLTKTNFRKLTVLFQERIKYDLNVDTQLMNTTLYWSPYPYNQNESNTNAFNLYCPKDGSSQQIDWPDVLVISFGIWIANYRNTLEGIDRFYAEVLSFRDCLAKLAKKVRILWLISVYPKQYWTDNTNYNHSYLDQLNAIAWHVLKDTGVWVWDTSAVLGYREQAFCPPQVNRTTGLFDTPVDWGCTDYMHPGKLYNVRSVNMIWNLVCNSQLGLQEEYCCS